MRESNQPPRRGTLVVFPGALGDWVCLVPTLQFLTRTTGELPRLFCQSSLVRLVEAVGTARVASLDRPELAGLFSSAESPEAADYFARFERIECFTGWGSSEVRSNLERWCGARARIHPFRPPRPLHLALHFLRAVQAPTTTLPEARVRLPPALVAARRRTLVGDASELNRTPLLVVHPGSGGRAKRWSRGGFTTLIRRWTKRGGRAVVVLGPAESDEARSWSEACVSVSTPVDTVDLAATLAVADVYLGNDSGPTHLAALLGGRGVALFGPTDFTLWRPLSSLFEVIDLAPWTTVDEEAREEEILLVERALARACEAGAHLDNPGGGD